MVTAFRPNNVAWDERPASICINTKFRDFGSNRP